jgi:hypothetical protein
LLRGAVANVAAARTLGPLSVTLELQNGSLRVRTAGSRLSIELTHGEETSVVRLDFTSFAQFMLDPGEEAASCDMQ